MEPTTNNLTDDFRIEHKLFYELYRGNDFYGFYKTFDEARDKAIKSAESLERLKLRFDDNYREADELF